MDAGSFAWSSARVPETQRDQQRRKAELVFDAFAIDGIDAMTIGHYDIALGREWMQTSLNARDLPVTLANFRCGGERPFAGHILIEEGGITLGVVGVLSTDRTVEGCETATPADALREEIAAMGDVDLVMVLSQLSDDGDEALAKAVPDVDLIVNGKGRLSRQQPKALANGAIQLGAGPKGKRLGVAEISLAAGGDGFSMLGVVEDLETRTARFKERLESATRNRDEAEDSRARRRAEKQIEYYTEEIARMQGEIAELSGADGSTTHSIRNDLRDLSRSVQDHPDVSALLTVAKADIEAIESQADIAALVGSPFVGSAACASCHKPIFADWTKTSHAQAWLTLTAENRHMDQACYQCHSTGSFHPEGPHHPKQVTPALQGVGCESCHGPGGEHVKNPAEADMVKNPPLSNCTQCHNGEQDQGRFDPATYLPKVNHSNVRTGD
ncbi:MAG: multiheme c-type cytochrome [Myxococcota bacterium]